MSVANAIEDELRELMRDHDIGGHGIDHMIAVMEHAKKAVAYENLPVYTKEKIIFASLLHDADDPKIFKDNTDNARTILHKSITDEYLISLLENTISSITPEILIQYRDGFISDIIELINLVSCSKNGNSDPEFSWMAIPRDCDRLEAIGEIGIKRCDEYSASINTPDYVDETPRVYTEEELWKIATPERFNKYRKSVSKIDHYYDKLLHIGKPECLKSKNKYVLQEAARRNNIMIKYVLNFWNTHQAHTI